MFKTFIKYFSILFSGFAAWTMLVLISMQPTAFASSHAINDSTPTAPYNNAVLTLALPNAATSGHAGTQIQLTGASFPPNAQVTLYVVTDPGQCTAGQSGVASIQPSSGSSMTDGNGGFQIAAPWPSSGATQANTAYYVCARVNDTNKASNTTFTVLPPSTASASPTTANPGDAVTISGQNWNAQEMLTVNITAGQGSQAVVGQAVTSDSNGSFNISLTIPTGTHEGAYGIIVTDSADTKQAHYFANAVTVNQQTTPTPQPTATATPTPTPATSPTTTPTSTRNNGASGSNNNGSMPWLIFGFGGLGIILVIVGLTMFLTNSHNS